ncbi:MAG: glycosyltransferase, partial [Rhodanobacter sp.]
GPLSPAALASALSAADVVLLPSLYEGCSFAVLEALACGAPLVTTQTGWVPDLVREVPGFDRYVAKTGDPEAFVVATRQALNGDREAQLAAQAFVAQQHDLNAFTDRWICYLESILGNDCSSSQRRGSAKQRLSGLHERLRSARKPIAR